MDIWFFFKKIVFFVVLFNAYFSAADVLEEYQPNESNPKQLNDFLDAVLKHKSDFKWIQQRNKERHKQLLSKHYKDSAPSDESNFLDTISKSRYHKEKVEEFPSLLDKQLQFSLEEDDKKASNPYNDLYPYSFSNNQDNQDGFEEDNVEEIDDDRHVREIRRSVPKLSRKKFAKLNRMRRNVDYYDEETENGDSNLGDVEIKTKSNAGTLIVEGQKLPERKYTLNNVNQDYNKDKFSNDYVDDISNTNSNSEEDLNSDDSELDSSSIINENKREANEYSEYVNNPVSQNIVVRKNVNLNNYDTARNNDIQNNINNFNNQARYEKTVVSNIIPISNRQNNAESQENNMETNYPKAVVQENDRIPAIVKQNFLNNYNQNSLVPSNNDQQLKDPDSKNMISNSSLIGRDETHEKTEKGFESIKSVELEEATYYTTPLTPNNLQQNQQISRGSKPQPQVYNEDNAQPLQKFIKSNTVENVPIMESGKQQIGDCNPIVSVTTSHITETEGPLRNREEPEEPQFGKQKVRADGNVSAVKEVQENVDNGQESVVEIPKQTLKVTDNALQKITDPNITKNSAEFEEHKVPKVKIQFNTDNTVSTLLKSNIINNNNDNGEIEDDTEEKAIQLAKIKLIGSTLNKNNIATPHKLLEIVRMDNSGNEQDQEEEEEEENEEESGHGVKQKLTKPLQNNVETNSDNLIDAELARNEEDDDGEKSSRFVKQTIKSCSDNGAFHMTMKTNIVGGDSSFKNNEDEDGGRQFRQQKLKSVHAALQQKPLEMNVNTNVGSWNKNNQNGEEVQFAKQKDNGIPTLQKSSRNVNDYIDDEEVRSKQKLTENCAVSFQKNLKSDFEEDIDNDDDFSYLNEQEPEAAEYEKEKSGNAPFRNVQNTVKDNNARINQKAMEKSLEYKSTDNQNEVNTLDKLEDELNAAINANANQDSNNNNVGKVEESSIANEDKSNQQKNSYLLQNLKEQLEYFRENQQFQHEKSKNVPLTNNTYYEGMKYVKNQTPFQSNPSGVELIPGKYKTDLKRNVHKSQHKKNKRFNNLINPYKKPNKFYLYDNAQFIPSYRSRQLKSFEEGNDDLRNLTRKKRSSSENVLYDYYEPETSIFKRSETEYMEEQEPVNSKKISIHYHEKKTNNSLANPSSSDPNQNKDTQLDGLNYQHPAVMRIRHYPKDEYFYAPRLGFNYRRDYKNDDGFFASRNKLISEEKDNTIQDNYIDRNDPEFSQLNNYKNRFDAEDYFEENGNRIGDREGEKNYKNIESDLQSMKDILMKDTIENDLAEKNEEKDEDVRNYSESIRDTEIKSKHSTTSRTATKKPNKQATVKDKTDENDENFTEQSKQNTKAQKFFSKNRSSTEGYTFAKKYSVYDISTESRMDNSKNEDSVSTPVVSINEHFTTDDTSYMISSISSKVAHDAFASAKLKFNNLEVRENSHKNKSKRENKNTENLNREDRSVQENTKGSFKLNGLGSIEDKYDMLSKSIMSEISNDFIPRFPIEKNTSQAPSSTIVTLTFRRSKRSPLSFGINEDSKPISKSNDFESSYNDIQKYGKENVNSADEDDEDEEEDYDYKKYDGSETTSSKSSGFQLQRLSKNTHLLKATRDEDNDELHSREQTSNWAHHGVKHKKHKEKEDKKNVNIKTRRQTYPRARRYANRKQKRSYNEKRSSKTARQDFSKIEEKYPWMKMGGVTMPNEYREYNQRMPRHSYNTNKKRHREGVVTIANNLDRLRTSKQFKKEVQDLCHENNTTPVSILSMRTEDPKEANLMTSLTPTTTPSTTTETSTKSCGGGLEDVEDGHLASRIVTKVKGELGKSEKLRKFADGLSEKYSKMVDHICFDFLHVDSSAFEGTEELLEQIKSVLSKLVDQQVKKKLCQHLPKELKSYLQFITDTKVSENELESEQNQYSNRQTHEQSAYLFGNPESNKPKTELELKKDALRKLLDVYNKMDDKCKERAAPVKEYIQQHLRTLQTLKRDVSPSVGSKKARKPEDTSIFRNLIRSIKEFLNLNKKITSTPSYNVEEHYIIHDHIPKHSLINRILNHKNRTESEIHQEVTNVQKVREQSRETATVELEQLKPSHEEEASAEEMPDEESRMIEKDLELLGLGKKKHNFHPKFSLDNMVEVKLHNKNPKLIEDSDDYSLQREEDSASRRHSKREVLKKDKWEQSDKYKNLAHAVQQLQRQQNSQDRIAKMYSGDLDSDDENRKDFNDNNFEKPLVYSLN